MQPSIDAAGPEERAGWLGPWRQPDFRVLFLATVFGGMGFWGELVVLGWYLLEESDSPLLVGLGVSAKIAPSLLVGLVGGALADRFDRRLLLRLYALGLALNATALGLLILVDAPIAGLLALTFVGGGLGALTQMTRQSYAIDLVGQAEGLGGVAMVYMGQRVGAIAGALVIGFFLAALGPGESYLLLSVAYVASFAVLLFARSRGKAAPVGGRDVLTNLREFLQELRHNRALAVLVLLTAAVEVLGFSHITLFPVLIRDVLEADAESLGLITGLAALGGVAAIIVVSLLTLRRRGLVFLLVLECFGLALIWLGLSTNLALALAAVIGVNAMAALSDVMSQSLVQLVVPNEMRGRASGAWSLAIGIAPAGHLQIGAVASLLGVPAALALNGGCLAALALLTLAVSRRLREL